VPGVGPLPEPESRAGAARHDATPSGVTSQGAFQRFLENILAPTVDRRVMIGSSGGNLPMQPARISLMTGSRLLGAESSPNAEGRCYNYGNGRI